MTDTARTAWGTVRLVWALIRGVGGYVADRFGRRGAMLVVFALGWLLIGTSVVVEPVPVGQEHLWHTNLPTPIRAGAWIVTGLVALWYSWAKGGRFGDAPGFAALYIMPAERALSFFDGWLAYVSDSPDGGYSRGWVSAVIYLVMMLMISIAAGWPEPPPRHKIREATAEAATVLRERGQA